MRHPPTSHTLPLLLLLCGALLGGATGCKQDPPASPDAGAPAEGTVKVTSEPSGAAVFVRQYNRLGVTPLTLRRPDGTALRLELVKEGYRRTGLLVVVEGGKEKVEHRKLPPAAGNLVVNAGPMRGARIEFNGKRVGRTPQKFEVEAGQEIAVRVTMDGFHPYSERVAVPAGRTATVTAVLIPSNVDAPAPGWLTLEANKPTMVKLKGKLIGRTPLVKIPLPPGRYTFTLENKPFGLRREVTLTVAAGEVVKEMVRFADPEPQGEPKAKSKPRPEDKP